MNEAAPDITPLLKLWVGIATMPLVVVTYAIVKAVSDSTIASLVAPLVCGFPLTGLEYVSWRRQTPKARLASAVRREHTRNPGLVVIYVILALQLAQGVIGFLVALGVASALSPYEVPAETEQAISISAATWVIVPVAAILLVYVARGAAYSIGRRAWLWLTVAIVGNIAVNLAEAFLINRKLWLDAVASNPGALAPWLSAIVVIYGVACAIGVAWARRTDGAHQLARAYRQLSPSDRTALVDISLSQLEPLIADDQPERRLSIAGSGLSGPRTA